MTKKGYTHIIVPEELHSQLKQLSQCEGVSISKLIEKTFSINTQSENCQKDDFENKPNSSLFFPSKLSLDERKVWWGRGDLNSRHSGITAPEHLHPFHGQFAFRLS